MDLKDPQNWLVTWIEQSQSSATNLLPYEKIHKVIELLQFLLELNEQMKELDMKRLTVAFRLLVDFIQRNVPSTRHKKKERKLRLVRKMLEKLIIAQPTLFQAFLKMIDPSLPQNYLLLTVLNDLASKYSDIFPNQQVTTHLLFLI